MQLKIKYKLNGQNEIFNLQIYIRVNRSNGGYDTMSEQIKLYTTQ